MTSGWMRSKTRRRPFVRRRSVDGAPPCEYELVGTLTGNCVRAAIALEIAGISYRVRRIDLGAGQQHDPHHLDLNPAGKVPVLTNVDAAPAFVLTQSNAIVLFAAERAPALLLPGDATARVRAYERYFQVVTDIIGPSHAGFHLRDPAARSVLDGMALDAVHQLERVLADHAFLAGPRFSIADIAGFTIIRTLLAGRDDAYLPAVAAWLARVGAMAAVQRGLAAFS